MLISAKEAQGMLGVGWRVLRNLVDDGRIPQIQHGRNSKRYYDPADIHDYIERVKTRRPIALQPKQKPSPSVAAAIRRCKERGI